MRKSLRVLIALTKTADIEKCESILKQAGEVCLRAPDQSAIEELAGNIDAIVADDTFAEGAFVSWLPLWPTPAVIAVSPDAEPSVVADSIIDEASEFIVRDKDDNWIRFIPMLVRRVTATRESLDRQNSNIIRTETSYTNLMKILPDIIYVLNDEGCFVYLNDAISQLGWQPSELLGKHFAEIVHPDDLPEVSRNIVLRRFEGITTGPGNAPKLFDERRTGDRMTRSLEVRLRYKKGSSWVHTNIDSWGEISSMGINLPELQGTEPGTIGLIHDISIRHEMEVQMAKELEHRDILIKEIHHRVKNNMQVISSLLAIESNNVEDQYAKNVFSECQNQIESMALVHEQLYRGTNLKGIDAGGYFARLAEYLFNVYDARVRGITLEVDANDIILPIDIAMPLAIITTELITNAFKYAFIGGRSGKINVSIKEDDCKYDFCVSDNGAGPLAIEEAKNSGIILKGSGLGTEIIDALASQLGGTPVRCSSEKGTSIHIMFTGKPNN